MRLERQALLDLRAQLVGPGFGAEDADAERGILRIETLPLHLVGDRQHVARRHHDDLGLEVGDELHLALGHAAAERNHREAEALGPVVRAESAGEQAVAVGHVHLVARARARGAHRARHDVRPGVDVLRGVADHRGLAGGARGGVDAHDLVHRHREHAEGIGLAQVGLGGERELRQVGERAAVAGFNAGGVEFLPEARHVVVRVRERPAQALELQAAQLLQRRFLDRLQREALHFGLRFSMNAATPLR